MEKGKKKRFSSDTQAIHINSKDKVKHHKKEPHHHKNSFGSDGGTSSVEGKRFHKPSASLVVSTGRRHKKSESMKFIGVPLQWHSEDLRNTPLYSDDYNICVVLVMEETHELTEFTASLCHAIASGSRMKYVSITGSEIETRVKQYMTTSNIRQPGFDDGNYMDRLDLWAEAIKNELLKVKGEALKEVDNEVEKVIEITGVRSKDQMQFIAPVTEEDLQISKMLPGAGSEPTPSPPDKSIKQKGPGAEAVDKKKKRDSKYKPKESVAISPEEAIPLKSENRERISDASALSSETADRKATFLPRRGAIAGEMFEVIDDSPQDGPNIYVVLAGFYNPRILDELHSVGVRVDSILLLTRGPVEKHNFSVMDIEEKITGVLPPESTLPQYANLVKSLNAQKKAESDIVSKFWLSFVDLINSADPDSFVHDIALINCVLPKMKKEQLSPEDRGVYGSVIFETLTKTIYNMLDLKEWYASYKNSFHAIEMMDPNLQQPHNEYNHLFSQIPSECQTVSILMDCLLQQVLINIGENPQESESSEVHIIPGLTADNEMSGETERLTPQPANLQQKNTMPMFLNNFDFATMRACHLNNNFASRLAATQINEDLTLIQNFVWNNIPDAYDEDLKLKVFESISNFMYFLPPNTLTFREMSFILHLLLAKGIEIQLHKIAETRLQVQFDEYTMMHDENSSESREDFSFPVTPLELKGPILKTKKPGETGEEETTAGEGTPNIRVMPVPTAVTEDYDADLSETDRPSPEQTAEATVDDVISQAAQAVQNPKYKPIEESELQTLQQDWTQCKGGPRSYFSQVFLNPNFKCPTPPNSDSGFSGHKPEETKLDEEDEGSEEEIEKQTQPPARHIACEEEFFNTLNEPSVVEKLVECPGLFPVGGNGRIGSFDSSQWTESYLMILGLCGSDGEGTNLGNLVDWNFMEEYRPTQMIQLLGEGLKNYTCFERVYVPYYDTIIFMFNNPTPASLVTDISFYTELKTRPGLQDFLEYTVNEPNVLAWILNVQLAKSAAITDSFSATTLLRLIPSRQWILNPSIKYTLLQRAKQEELRTELGLPLNLDLDSDEDEEEFGQLKREKARKGSTEEEQSTIEKTVKSKARVSIKESVRSTNKTKFKQKTRSEIEAQKARSAKAIQSIPLVNSGTDSTISINVLSDRTDSPELDTSSSFNFTDALRASQGQGLIPSTWKNVPDISEPKFSGYDMGKRIITVASNTTHLFPMDGTKISYEIQTVDPNVRMMQLCIEKSGHTSCFYPYYIPHDIDLATEPYVVTPSFHLTHSTGIIFAFHDKRLPPTRSTEPTGPKVEKFNQDIENVGVFNYDHVIFGSDDWKHKRFGSKETPSLGKIRHLNTKDRAMSQIPDDDSDGGSLVQEKDLDTKSRSKLKKAKSKKIKDTKSKKLTDKRSKKLKKKYKGKEASQEEREDTADETGEYFYSSAENTEEDLEFQEQSSSFDSLLGKPKVIHYNFSWRDATKILDPMNHNFRISFPSGLCIEVDDCEGPPMSRHVRQAYQAKSSGNLISESSRYYLSNGSVIRFLMNKTIQLLNVRGVTTLIRELFADGSRDENDIFYSILNSKNAKIFNGTVVHPSGEYWKFVNGHRKPHPPMEVFTSSPLPSGEVFTRRQDGLVYLHRADGTVITHYPDGTRFTSRMVTLEEPTEEFADWIFVGVKLMVENPHYATVLFNSLSGNVHIKLSQGGWVRVFSDGSIRVNCEDNYKLDVDKNRAVISTPPCNTSNCKDNTNTQRIPNMVAVKLWHSPEFFIPTTNVEDVGGQGDSLLDTRTSKVKLTTGPMPKKSKYFHSIHFRSTSDPNQSILNPNLRATVHSFPKIPSMPSLAHLSQHSINTESPYPPPNTFRPNFEIEDFMTFTDMWTFCKAIDSWDNRFAVDIFGQKVIDKSESFVKKSTEDLVESISQNFLIPKRYVSGILNTTSSENLLTKDNRIKSFLSTTPSDSCEKNPKVKIFVMKRDLTGYQFLKKSTVDHIIKKAKSNPESMITTNINKSGTKEHRSITILEPISCTGVPHGTWKSTYREPVFRPSGLIKVMNPVQTNSKLRWFAEVLLNANLRRPSFVKSPKELYAIKREEILNSPEKVYTAPEDPIVTANSNISVSKKPDIIRKDANETPNSTGSESKKRNIFRTMLSMSKWKAKSSRRKSTFHHMAASLENEDEEEEKEESEEEEDNENEMELKDDDTKSTYQKKSKKDKSKGKGKKDKGNKAESKSNKKGKQKDSGDVESGKKSKVGKKGKGKKQDESELPLIELVYSHSQTDQKRQSEDRLSDLKSELLGSNEYEQVYPFPIQRKEFRYIPFKDMEYKDYPDDIPDITDVYGIGEAEDSTIRQQYHPDALPRPKKVIVVRTIKEIPKLDEKLQRALLSASVSYSETLPEEEDVEEQEGEIWPELEDDIAKHQTEESETQSLVGKVKFSFVQHDDGAELLLSNQTNDK